MSEEARAETTKEYPPDSYEALEDKRMTHEQAENHEPFDRFMDRVSAWTRVLDPKVIHSKMEAERRAQAQKELNEQFAQDAFAEMQGGGCGANGCTGEMPPPQANIPNPNNSFIDAVYKKLAEKEAEKFRVPTDEEITRLVQIYYVPEDGQPMFETAAPNEVVEIRTMIAKGDPVAVVNEVNKILQKYSDSENPKLVRWVHWPTLAVFYFVEKKKA